jgi:hypothetical protein
MNIRKGWGEFSSFARFEMGGSPILDFGMTSDVGIMPLRKIPRIYSVFLVLRVLQWQI